MKKNKGSRKNGKFHKSLIKWNKKKHDEKVTEQEKAQEEIHNQKLLEKCYAMYVDWRRRVKHAIAKGKIVTRKDLTQCVEQLKLNIRQEIGKIPELNAWMKATFIMLDDFNAKLASDYFEKLSDGGSGEAAPLTRIEKRIAPPDGESGTGTDGLSNPPGEPS